MKTIGTFVLAALVLAIVAPTAVAGISHKRLQAAVHEFNEEWRPSRDTPDPLQLNYLEYGDRSFAYYLPNRLIDLAAGGETFRVRKIRYEDSYVHIYLETEREARVSFFVFDDRVYGQAFLDEVVPRVLAEVFTFRAASGRSRYVANTSSGLLHLRGCNHLPPVGERRAEEDRAAAEAAGLRACPVCFATEHNLPLEGYRSLRMEALETARLKELAFPPVQDAPLQARLARCGEAVLNDFPIELRGFDYRFQVLHSEVPNAFSIATGFVYVTDKLMAAVEDSLELALILAHEVAHCEMNRQVAEPLFVGDPLVVEAALREYFIRLRFRETECDVLGLLTLARRTPWEQVFTRARGGLAKLQFAGESLPVSTSAYATHPGYQKRLAMLDPDLFHVVDEADVFEARDKGGRLLARAQAVGWQKVILPKKFSEVGGEIGGGSARRTRYNYYFLVETTDLLNRRVTNGDGRLTDREGKKVGFEGGDLPFVIMPGESAVVMLRTDDKPVSLGQLKELKLDLSDQIASWRPAGG